MTSSALRHALLSATFVTVAASLALTRGVGAQAPAGTATINVWAVTAQGTPVSDLSSENFSVTVAGQVRPVREFTASAVEAASGRAGAAGPKMPPVTALPSPFDTNASPAGGRTFYLVVDTGSLDEAAARQLGVAARGWLEALPAWDEVAVDTIEDARLLPTTHHAAVQAALDALGGRSGPPPSLEATAVRSRAVLARLDGLFRALRGAPTPPVVILCTSGLSNAALTSALGGPRAAAPGRAGATPAVGTFSELRMAEALASPALYVVQLATASSAADTGGLHVASTQLGAALLATPWSTNPLVQISEETVGYYRLMVATPELSPDIDYPAALTVTRPGVTLRYVPAVAWRAPTERPTLDDVLAARDLSVAFPLRMTTLVSRAAAGTVAATAVFDAEGQTAVAAAGAVLLDAAGRVVTKVTLPAPALTPRPLTARLVAPPGRYRLRVAARDGAGADGSVEAAVDVGLTVAGPLKLGSLGLGVATPASAAPAARAGRPQGLPPPTPQLAFGPERDGLAFFDIYGGVPNEQVRIVMEIRRRPDGPAVEELQPKIQPAAVGEPDHYLVTAPIALSDLSPGDYQVEATVTVGSQAPAVLVRTLRKTG